ncbi:hypothetical protein D0962_15365 [Leptolyngbyaceae cyanobacterium CCMR0082]|uniref:Uncharacterized protein n=1 Tax=Adonisia turfae CCMR0082 TaxID=2304604 RepID=A0A6M0S8L8_9CYAN|nr:hypothetical protein [Adonisia turfae]NEZ64152.1 hypothetical protein [Adonisia turfae CCMR0082]
MTAASRAPGSGNRRGSTPNNSSQHPPAETPQTNHQSTTESSYRTYTRKAKGHADKVYTYATKAAPLWVWGIVFAIVGGIVSMQVGWLGDLIGWLGLICLVISAWRFLTNSLVNTWAVIASFMSLVALIVLGMLFFQSAHIYASAGRAIAPESGLINLHNLGAEIFKGFPILGWLVGLSLRGLAGVVRGLELTAFGLLGVMIYVIIQSGEVMPVILKASPETLQRLIKTLQKFKKVEVSNNESATVRELASIHNNYYESLIDALGWWRCICYAVDFVVCLWFAPWIVGGWSNFDQMAGWENANWPNIIRGLISVVFFEVAVRLWIIARKGVYLFGKK